MHNTFNLTCLYSALINLTPSPPSSTTRVSYTYQIAVSPADGQVYVSDPEKYKVLRVLSLQDVTDPSTNSETVAGNGERCIPGE